MNFENILAEAIRREENCQQGLDRWAERFAANPSEALSWGTGVYGLAVTRDLMVELADLCRTALDDVEDRGADWHAARIRGIYTSALVCKAKHLENRSTNPCHNILEDAKVSALAELIEPFGILEE